MPNSYEELLKGQEYMGTIGDMPGQAAQKMLLLIFIVDNSGSMEGDRMDQVNRAFREMVPTLQEIQNQVNDAFELKIAVLVFGSTADWKVEPTPILQYVHMDIDSYGGGTNYTRMLEKLQSKLSRKEYMEHTGKIAQPYIMLMTDGKPNDSGYQKVIDDLQQNLWYKEAQRYAVLIGEGAINDEKARQAVRTFVTDEHDGIVTAKEAHDIVKVVSAKTIHTIRNMTMRKMDGETGEIRKEPSGQGTAASREQTTEGTSGSGGGNPYGDEWTFPTVEPDPESVYNGKFVF